MQNVKNEFRKDQLFLVGIAASAGGLEPMRELLGEAACHGSMSFVVVSHLARYEPSDLTRILERASHIRAIEIEDGMHVENCRLYVIPPNFYVTLHDSRFKLEPRPLKTPNVAANVFFKSLASHYGANAIGVVLSGASVGADGSEGVAAIKKRGGHTYAQSPETAEYSAMPLLAIETGHVDTVAAPEQLGHDLSLAAWALS